MAFWSTIPNDELSLNLVITKVTAKFQKTWSLGMEPLPTYFIWSLQWIKHKIYSS